MKSNIPLFITFSIFLGLLTFVLSTNYLYDGLLDNSPDGKIILFSKDSQNSDTLTVNSLARNVPTAVVGKEKIKKRFYLNVFPATLNWITFHSVALSLSMASIIYLIALIVNLKKSFAIKFFSRETLKVIVPILLVAILLLVLMSYSKIEWDQIVYGGEIMNHFNIVFNDPQDITRKIQGAFFVISIVPLCGLIMISLATSVLHNLGAGHQRDLKADCKKINDRLNIFALFSGLLVAVSIVGTRLQRAMIAEQVPGIENIYPDAFIYAYSITFTLILALFFLPPLAFLKYVQSNKIPSGGAKKENVSWWKIGKESMDDIKLIFSIVLPLLTSIVQSFLK